MKLYITKYIFTRGIVEIEGSINSDGTATTKIGIFSERDWCTSLEDARNITEELIHKKISNLYRQVGLYSSEEFVTKALSIIKVNLNP